MPKESMVISKFVRATLTQLGVDTRSVGIMISGTTVQIKGEIRLLQTSPVLSDKKLNRLMEMIGQRLRQHKQIKRVMFL